MSAIFDYARTGYISETAGDVWTDVPSNIGILVYSFLTPAICLCGMMGNSLCLAVLNKKQFVCSFYVYLRVISIVDFGACVVIFISGLARGALWWKNGWVSYDALISVPVGGFFSNMSTVATIFVTIDRLIYLRDPLRRSVPKFCSRRIALKVMGYGVVISIAFTLPYCFIYKFTNNGSLTTTDFYKSRTYMYYNWIDFTIFAVLPLAFLLVGNIMLLWSIRRARRIQKRCELVKKREKKLVDQTKLTITLIAIVFFYLIGEVPTHLTARKTAANLLFGGNDESADESVALQIGRQVTTVLNALHLASKFILYSFFCPPFCRALKATLTGKPQKDRGSVIQAKDMHVELFLVSEAIKMNKGIKLDLRQLEFLSVFINTKAAQELPRLI